MLLFVSVAQANKKLARVSCNCLHEKSSSMLMDTIENITLSEDCDLHYNHHSKPKRRKVNRVIELINTLQKIIFTFASLSLSYGSYLMSSTEIK